MVEDVEYRCFIGNLSWSTSDRGLKHAFEKFGNLIEAKVMLGLQFSGTACSTSGMIKYFPRLKNNEGVWNTRIVVDKFSGRSRGFGFVTFDEKKAMEDAIEAMNGMDLDGRAITVDKAQPLQGSNRDYDNDRPRDRDRDRGRDHGHGNHEYGGTRGSGGGECFRCGKPGHFARECPSEGSRGGRYGERDDRYGGGGGSRPDRNGDRYGSRSSRDGGSHGGGERSNRDRSGPYDRRGSRAS